MPFRCCVCGQDKQEEPFIINACGTLCRECEMERKRKALDGFKRHLYEKSKQRDGICSWCRKREADDDGKRGRVCGKCSTMKRWLLSCIRESDRPARYVAWVEKRESTVRNYRNTSPNMASANNSQSHENKLTESMSKMKEEMINLLKAKIEEISNA